MSNYVMIFCIIQPEVRCDPLIVDVMAQTQGGGELDARNVSRPTKHPFTVNCPDNYDMIGCQLNAP